MRKLVDLMKGGVLVRWLPQCDAASLLADLKNRDPLECTIVEDLHRAGLAANTFNGDEREKSVFGDSNSVWNATSRFQSGQFFAGF